MRRRPIPGNRLLWAFPRHRLEGEVIRDSSLLVAGLLNPKVGGPSVYPGIARRDAGAARRVEGVERRRPQSAQRLHFRARNSRYPMMEAFDMPDTHESCSRRDVTTTAPQALTMLNDRVALEWAQAFRGAGAGGEGSGGHGVPAGLFAAAGRVGEGHGGDVLPQAEVRDRERAGARREAGAAAGDAGRRGRPRTRRRSSISARC